MLTSRQIMVARLARQGLVYGAIARRVGKSYSTVSRDMRVVFKELGVKTASEITLDALNKAANG